MLNFEEGFAMIRSLEPDFMTALKAGGELNCLLELVKNDDTLQLEIRNNYINIYYRGGSLLQVAKKIKGYDPVFNINYSDYTPKTKVIVEKLSSVEDYADNVHYVKKCMDSWFCENPKNEREAQQVITRENNEIKADKGASDYLVIDIEYGAPKETKNANLKKTISKFDLIAIKTHQKKKNSAGRENIHKNPRLAIAELKFEDGAMSNVAGIVAHFKDIASFVKDKSKTEDLFSSAEAIFKQKKELGLISGDIDEIKFNREKKFEFLLLFANHNPYSKVLSCELHKALEKYPDLKNLADIKIAHSSFMGYGLYDSCMVNIDDFVK